MTQGITLGGNELVPAKPAAKMLGVSVQTLRWWRYKRRALPWVVVGGRKVMYRKSDIVAFIERGVIDPTEAAHG